jgi:hypothetical protein
VYNKLGTWCVLKDLGQCIRKGNHHIAYLAAWYCVRVSLESTGDAWIRLEGVLRVFLCMAACNAHTATSQNLEGALTALVSQVNKDLHVLLAA